jgi:hypothetical protein
MRHGRRWEAINSTRALKNVKRNMVEDRGSLLKFVGGVTRDITLSCRSEKSSILFWRSRIFRKKSLDSSFTGLTMCGGARGGPAVEYVKYVEFDEVSGVIVCGCAGWRAINAGIRRARSIMASGSTERRYGSRHTKEYMARNEIVWVGMFQVMSRIAFAWNTKTTPIRELNRRKFADIVGRENDGRTVRSGIEESPSLFESVSARGITCWSNLVVLAV